MSEQLDLLLINPANRKKIYQSLSTTMSAIEPPVWAGLMATYVRGKGFSVNIIDMGAVDVTTTDVAQMVKEMNPRLVSIVVYGHQPSASTQVMPGASAVCDAIKDLTPEQKVIMVGGHVASLPQRTLEEENCDYVASGEGLMTMVELLQALDTPSPQLHKVVDLWYYDDDGQLQMNAPAPLIKNLDEEMRGLAWDLLPMDTYRAHNWHCLDTLERQPYVALYTTLGCPYHCSFCCIQAPFKSGERVLGIKESVNSYRFWSPQNVINEIDYLVKEHGVRNIKIADEMFVLNKRHVNAICDLIIERGYDLNIWAYTRVDTVKDDMIDKMKQAGINWLAFGIEAANAKVRDEVQKGVDQDDIFKVIHRVQEGGINIIGNYIFGLPEDDYDTMQETLDMAIELNTEFANFYSAMAYPGSPLYNTAIKEGWRLPDNWSGYSQHAIDTLPLPTKHLTGPEVLAFRDQAFHSYFEGDRYLNMVEEKFGEDTRQHIVDMTEHRLERQYTPTP